MAYNLLRLDREQGYLMPPSVREWLGEEDLAWFVVDAVEQMDRRELYAGYRSDSWPIGPDRPLSGGLSAEGASLKV